MKCKRFMAAIFVQHLRLSTGNKPVSGCPIDTTSEQWDVLLDDGDDIVSWMKNAHASVAI